MEEENNHHYSEHSPRPREEREPVHVTPRPEPVPVGSDNLEDRVFAALSYISVLFVVPLILKSEDGDIHYHAKQGVALFGAEVVVWFALFLLDTFLTAIFPNRELVVVRLIGALAWVLFMGLSIAGVYMAGRGKRWKMPVIGRLAQKIRI